MSGSLSDHDVAGYRRDGFIYPIPVLTQSEAASYRQSIDLFEQRFNLPAGDVIRNKGHLKHVILYQMIRHQAILDAVESVLGPNILCWGSSLFVKDPGDPGYIAWHQDSYYWGLDPDDVVSAWVALTPSTIENGAMRVVPGSHAGLQHSHMASSEGSANMLFTHEEIAVDVDESDPVALTLRFGEMSLHHVKIVHGSSPNRSRERRVGYAIRYVAPHVRQRGEFASATLVRGVDDYGNFAADPVPTRDMDPDIVAFVDGPLGGLPGGKIARDFARGR